MKSGHIEDRRPSLDDNGQYVNSDNNGQHMGDNVQHIDDRPSRLPFFFGTGFWYDIETRL